MTRSEDNWKLWVVCTPRFTCLTFLRNDLLRSLERTSRAWKATRLRTIIQYRPHLLVFWQNKLKKRLFRSFRLRSSNCVLLKMNPISEISIIWSIWWRGTGKCLESEHLSLHQIGHSMPIPNFRFILEARNLKSAIKERRKRLFCVFFFLHKDPKVRPLLCFKSQQLWKSIGEEQGTRMRQAN